MPSQPHPITVAAHAAAHTLSQIRRRVLALMRRKIEHDDFVYEDSLFIVSYPL